MFQRSFWEGSTDNCPDLRHSRISRTVSSSSAPPPSPRECVGCANAQQNPLHPVTGTGRVQLLDTEKRLWPRSRFKIRLCGHTVDLALIGMVKERPMITLGKISIPKLLDMDGTLLDSLLTITWLHYLPEQFATPGILASTPPNPNLMHDFVSTMVRSIGTARISVQCAGS